MAGERLIGSNTMPEDVFLEPEKLLRDLAEAPARPVPDAQGSAPAAASPRYCSSCWGVLPNDTAHCPNCGRSIAEMDAALQAKRAADRAWVPPRQAESTEGHDAANHGLTAGLGVVPPVVTGPAVPEPLARELRKSRHHFLMAVAIGSAWGGAVMVAAWFTIQNFSPNKAGGPSGATTPGIVQPVNSPSIPVANVPEAGDSPAVQVQPKPDARIVWKNPFSELRAELYSRAGRKVAVQGEDARVAAGQYQVRIYPRSGDWHIDGTEVHAEDGELVEVSVTPQQAGLFFQKLGDRFYDRQKLDDAVSAWQRAVEIDPKQIRAHLRLGTTLPLQHRYRDAREHLDAVLTVNPNDKDAIEGVHLLDALEKER